MWLLCCTVAPTVWRPETKKKKRREGKIRADEHRVVAKAASLEMNGDGVGARKGGEIN